jgi:hypothetical protein
VLAGSRLSSGKRRTPGSHNAEPLSQQFPISDKPPTLALPRPSETHGISRTHPSSSDAGCSRHLERDHARNSREFTLSQTPSALVFSYPTYSANERRQKHYFRFVFSRATSPPLGYSDWQPSVNAPVYWSAPRPIQRVLRAVSAGRQLWRRISMNMTASLWSLSGRPEPTCCWNSQGGCVGLWVGSQASGF